MNANDSLDTGLPVARIERLRVTAATEVEVVWAEGERAGRTERIDLAPILFGYVVYRPLRAAPDLFATARLIDDGYAVAWDGLDVDMSADAIETLADQIMTPADFAAFLKRNRLTQEAAAILLGRSRRQIAYYLKPGPIPRIVALACYGDEALQARSSRVA